jgi:alkaline phosphatase
LLAASAVAFPQVAVPAQPGVARAGQLPRNIIMLVVDGMSMGTFTCADHLSQLSRNRPLTFARLYQHPGAHTGLMNMRSLNSLVTDSSAASSAWGSGTLILNGKVNEMSKGQKLTTIYELLGQAGWKRGLVTTTEITHATPAGFATSTASRDSAAEIASQYLDRKVEVLLGGGAKFFGPPERKDKRDLFAEFQQAGYFVMDTRAQLDAAPLDKSWLGTFAASHLPFTVDHVNDPALVESVPTLAAMTRAALKRLEREQRFILQVEGGRVDHGGHNCDAAAAIHDQIAFDEAIDACIEFQRRVPDTLIVITSDHGNANFGLNGMGSGYNNSNNLLANLRSARRSLPEMMKHIKRRVSGVDTISSPEEIAEVIHAGTGYKVSARRTGLFAGYLSRKTTALYDMMNGDLPQFGQLMANHYGINMIGNAHTADYVPVLALGPGAERFRGFLQATDVFHHFMGLAKINFRNPTEPLTGQIGPEALEVENIEEYQVA